VLKLVLRRLPSALLTMIALPVVAGEYFRSSTGRAYGITLATKLRILAQMIRNNVRIQSGSNFISHLLMAGRIMNVPPETAGVLVECGCFKGGSTANLSLVAAACGRKLHAFDSFAGLPSPEGDDVGHVILADLEVRTYEEGGYAGTLDEVRENIRRYGALDVCEFHVGYFEQTMPEFEEPVIFAYVDVDLTKSEETCLRELWPLLAEGSALFTDEAHHLEIAGLFYDRQWWQQELGTSPPGLVGAGNGIGLFLHEGGFRSGLGYTVKMPPAERLSHRPG